jgi:hypothetical protein
MIALIVFPLSLLLGALDLSYISSFLLTLALLPTQPVQASGLTARKTCASLPDEAQRDAAIREVTQAFTSFADPDGLVYPCEAVLGKARKG